MVKKVLIVYYSLSGNTRAAAEAVAVGVREAGGEPVLKCGLEAGPEDLLACAAVAAGTPDYFNYMAGGLKDFFDRSLYPTIGKVENKPYGAFVTHGGGGRARRSMEEMGRAFKFRMVADTILVEESPDEAARQALAGLGRKMVEAAGRPAGDPD